MHVLGLVDAERKQPFYNFGGHPVSTFQDLTVDGHRLLLELEKISGEHFDVVSALTSEFPSGAVEFLDDLLGTDNKWRVSMGWDTRSNEVPIYFCPVDYDILCGGIVATIERTDDQIRMHQFRHTSTEEQYNEKVTEALSALDFTFTRSATDTLLERARSTFAEEANNWVRPDWQISAFRRWLRRVQRRRER
jgi:hypothetical protein